VLPGLSKEQRQAKAEGVAKWVKSLPLGSKPLVKTSVKMLPDEGVLALQRAMPILVSWIAVGKALNCGEPPWAVQDFFACGSSRCPLGELACWASRCYSCWQHG
jgi:hypothetical protein